MSFRKFPPTKETWNALCDALERAGNWRSDGSVQIGVGARSMIASIPERSTVWEQFNVKITFNNGDGSYSGVTVEQKPSGAHKDTASFDAPLKFFAGGDPDAPAQTVSGGYRPLWERNYNWFVPIGTIVTARAHYLTGAAAPEMEYEFDWWITPPVPAQITSSGAPTTTLSAGMAVNATTATIASAANMPGRLGFRALIDEGEPEEEVVEVGGGAGTTSWSSITRALDATCARAHLSGATVKLIGVYAWDEQQPLPTDNGGWEDRANKRTGTFLSEGAFDRNHTRLIPDNTYVLLWQRSRDADGYGSSTITEDLDTTETGVDVTSRSSFPQVVPFHIRVGDEYMKVTAGQGTGAGTFTVTRGVYGTNAQAHYSGQHIIETVCEWVFDARIPYLRPVAADDLDWDITTTLNGGISATASSLTAADAGKFPSQNKFVIAIDSEEILVVTGFGTNSWGGLIRGWHTTTPAAHSNGATIYLNVPGYIQNTAKFTHSLVAPVYPGDTSCVDGNEAIFPNPCQPIDLTGATQDADGFWTGAQLIRYDPKDETIDNVYEIEAIDLNDF